MYKKNKSLKSSLIIPMELSANNSVLYEFTLVAVKTPNKHLKYKSLITGFPSTYLLSSYLFTFISNFSREYQHY